MSFDDTFSAVPMTYSRKLDLMLACFNSIHENVWRRDLALFNYDRALGKSDPVYIKRSTEVLSVKQTRQYHSLEVQLDHFKTQFDGFNNVINI